MNVNDYPTGMTTSNYDVWQYCTVYLSAIKLPSASLGSFCFPLMKSMLQLQGKGDSILNVNGITDDVTTMLDRCKTDMELELTLCRSLNYDHLIADIERLITSKSCGPLMVRLSWHDGTGHANTPKWLDVAMGLLKAIREKNVPRLISSADLQALVANTAIKLMGGPEIPTRFGRADAIRADAGGFPNGDQDAKYIREVLGPKGCEEKDMVALMGANVCGMCHVETAGFDKKFDNSYFKDLLTKQWEAGTSSKGTPQFQCEGAVMFPSDMALIEDPNFKVHVERYAADEKLWLDDFAKAWVKLQEFRITDLREIL